MTIFSHVSDHMRPNTWFQRLSSISGARYQLCIWQVGRSPRVCLGIYVGIWKYMWRSTQLSMVEGGLTDVLLRAYGWGWCGIILVLIRFSVILPQGEFSNVEKLFQPLLVFMLASQQYSKHSATQKPSYQLLSSAGWAIQLVYVVRTFWAQHWWFASPFCVVPRSRTALTTSIYN